MEISELCPKKPHPGSQRLQQLTSIFSKLLNKNIFEGFVVAVVVLNLAPKIRCKRAKLATYAAVRWVPEAVEFLTRLSAIWETHQGAFRTVIAVSVPLLPSSTHSLQPQWRFDSQHRWQTAPSHLNHSLRCQQPRNGQCDVGCP